MALSFAHRCFEIWGLLQAEMGLLQAEMGLLNTEACAWMNEKCTETRKARSDPVRRMWLALGLSQNDRTAAEQTQN